MKTSKLLSYAILATILGLTSCSKDDDGNKLSKNDAQSKLTEFNTTAVSDLQSLSSAEGLTAVKDLFNLVDTDDPFSRIGTDKQSIKQFFREKGKEFKTIFVPASATGRTEEDPFNFDAKKGVYTWNADLNQFEKTGESTIISIFFPAGSSLTNNAELQITEYTETQYYDSEFQEYYYYPAILKAAVFVNDLKVASLDLDIQWTEGFPSAADITIFVSPFTANISFSGTASSSTLSTFLKKGDEVIVSTSVTVKFDNNTKTAENLNSIEGYVQLKNIKVQGNIDVKAADVSTTGDPNDYIHLSLYADNKKVGDIIFVNEMVDGNEEYVAYLRYNDGSKEKLEVVLKPVFDEIDTLING